MNEFESDWATLCLPSEHGKTAFDLAPREIRMTPAEAKAEAHRVDVLQRYHRKVALAKATRINKATFTISPAPQADADRMNRISGRRNAARSQ